jgi:PTS system maltose and glucose-specific IIC component
VKDTSSVGVKDKSLVDKDTIIKKYESLGFAENGMQMQSIYGAYANVLKMGFKIF